MLNEEILALLTYTGAVSVRNLNIPPFKVADFNTTLLPLIKTLIISVFLARLDLHYFQYCFSDYCRGIIITL
jgi:hypothetical protein